MKRAKMPEKNTTDTDKMFSVHGHEINLAGLTELDILLPYEHEQICAKRLLAPEEELIAAVLEQAVADFQRYVFCQEKKSRRRFLDAAEWIADDNNDGVFAFIHCCEVLGIEPGYLRRGLARWQQDRSGKKLFGVAASPAATQSARAA